MAIVAKFQADFSDFAAGVAEADAQLATFGASTSRAGGEVDKLSAKTSATILPFNTLGQSMRQFDGVLSSVGVNLSPQIRAIEDLSAASGKTATQLGGFATAGLVAGAAMAGWQTGRAIAGFFGLDKAIGDATAKLLGFSAAGVTEAAKLDVITKAIANGAKSYITYTDAIVFNQKAHDAWRGPIEAAAKLKDFEASLNTASAAVYNLTQHEKDVIRAALAVGKSHADIAAALGLTTDAIDLYVKGTQRAEQGQAKAAAEAEKLAGKVPAVTKSLTDASAATQVYNTGMVITTGVVADLASGLQWLDQWLNTVADSEMKWARAKVDMAKGGSQDLNNKNALELAKFQGLNPRRVKELIDQGYSPADALAIARGAPQDAFTPSQGKGGGTKSAPSPKALAASPILQAGGFGDFGGGRGGHSVVAPVVVNVSGVMDPATIATITKAVGAEVTRSVLQVLRL